MANKSDTGNSLSADRPRSVRHWRVTSVQDCCASSITLGTAVVAECAHNEVRSGAVLGLSGGPLSPLPPIHSNV